MISGSSPPPTGDSKPPKTGSTGRESARDCPSGTSTTKNSSETTDDQGHKTYCESTTTTTCSGGNDAAGEGDCATSSTAQVGADG